MTGVKVPATAGGNRWPRLVRSRPFGPLRFLQSPIGRDIVLQPDILSLQRHFVESGQISLTEGGLDI